MTRTRDEAIADLAAVMVDTARLLTRLYPGADPKQVAVAVQLCEPPRVLMTEYCDDDSVRVLLSLAGTEVESGGDVLMRPVRRRFVDRLWSLIGGRGIRADHSTQRGGSGDPVARAAQARAARDCN